MRGLLLMPVVCLLAGCGSAGSSRSIHWDKIAPRLADEWLPSCVPELKNSPEMVQEFRKKVGLTLEGPVLFQQMDLDGDECNEGICTVCLQAIAGARATRRCHVTYVFKGRNRGVGGISSPLWFSLVTYDSLDSVDYGETEVRRQFRVRNDDGRWMVEILEYTYKIGPGEGADCFTRYGGTKVVCLPVEALKVGKIDEGLNLPEELPKAGK